MQAMGVKSLKEKLIEAITHFVNGRDCFVILPPGMERHYVKEIDLGKTSSIVRV